MVSASLFSCLTVVASQDEFLSRHSQVCPADVMQCPDGSHVSRDPSNNCEFPSCGLLQFPGHLQFCTADVMQCPDGSYVSRDSMNGCAFKACPTDGRHLNQCIGGFRSISAVADDAWCQSNCAMGNCPVGFCECPSETSCVCGEPCTMVGGGLAVCQADGTTCAQNIQAPNCGVCLADVQECADGTFVSRDAANNCAFPDCPTTVCPADVQECPDGSHVSRNPANDCAFPECPTTCACGTACTMLGGGLGVCQADGTTCAHNIQAPNCGSQVDCDSCPSGFFDGCNFCGCSNDSTPFCTLKFCHPEDIQTPLCFNANSR